MKKAHGFVFRMVLAALCASAVLLSVPQAHAVAPAFVGNFTLTQPTHWGGTVLPAGSYTISLRSNAMPAIVLITDSKGHHVAQFVSGIVSGNTGTRNALFVKEKGGHPYVYSLQLASLNRVLIYDVSLAQEAVLEARAPQTVPVMLAKR
jgi:hypothetical protein